MKKKAIKIDAEEMCVKVIEWETLEDLQNHVGGLIEVFPYGFQGEVMLVNEEAFLQVLNTGFILAGQFHVLGNALIVSDEDGEFWSTKLNVEDVRSKVEF